MATLNNIIEQVRAHPGIAGSEVATRGDDEFGFAVAQLIFPCLEELSERFANTGKRNYLMTDPGAVMVTLDDDGAASLLSTINTYGLLIDMLQDGEIRHESSPYPLVEVAHSGEGALPSNYSTFGFIRYWIKGTKIFTVSTDNNANKLTGDLTFSCPRIVGLDALSVNLEGRLVDTLVERLRRSPLRESLPK